MRFCTELFALFRSVMVSKAFLSYPLRSFLRLPTWSGLFMNSGPTSYECAIPFHYILSIHNVCINGNFFLWILIGRPTFAWRKRTTERISCSAGFWIDAVIIIIARRNKPKVKITNDCERMVKYSRLQSVLLTLSLKLFLFFCLRCIFSFWKHFVCCINSNLYRQIHDSVTGS